MQCSLQLFPNSSASLESYSPGGKSFSLGHASKFLISTSSHYCPLSGPAFSGIQFMLSKGIFYAKAIVATAKTANGLIIKFILVKI